MSKRSQKANKFKAKDTGNNNKVITKPRKSHQALMLEQRIMFDAAAIATLAEADTHHQPQAIASPTHDGLADAVVGHVLPPDSMANGGDQELVIKTSGSTGTSNQDNYVVSDTRSPATAQPLLVLSAPAAAHRQEIVFIESNVDDISALLQTFDPSREVHIIDASKNGLEQIATILEGRSNIDALHIITHGARGWVDFGSLKSYDHFWCMN